MDKFQAFRCFKEDKKIYGKLTEITLEDLDKGDLIVEAKYSSVNFKDALGATGKGHIFKKWPINGGIDVSGIVLESKSPSFKKGDLVLVTGCGLGEAHDGGYSKFVRVPSEWAIPIPKYLSLEESMIFGTAGFTAGICLHRMEVNDQTPEKGPIAVTGASGGVGSFGVMMMAKKGYEVVAISGKESSHDYLKQLGASKVVSLEKLELGSRPLEKGKFGGAIDNLGGEALAKLLAHISPWGNVASVGLAAHHGLQSTVMPFILRGVSMLGISSANCPMDLRKKIWDRIASELKPETISNMVHKKIKLEDLPTAFEDILNRKVQGRIIVEI